MKSVSVRRALVVVASLVIVGCSGPTVPLEVGLADRPVDLLLGERVTAVAEAMVPPMAIPPGFLPTDIFDMPAGLPPFDLTATPPTVSATFPSFTAPTTTIPVGCSATPPKRTFADAPDTIQLPPVPTPDGERGYVTRTSGKIEIGAKEVATTVLPQLTTRRIENLEVHSRLPSNLAWNQSVLYSDRTTYATGAPKDYTFDVVVDLGNKMTNRTTYRVLPAYVTSTNGDRYSDANGDGVIEGMFADGKVDDFFKDANGDKDGADTIDQFFDTDKNGSISTIERYIDLNKDGVITTQVSPSETMPTPEQRDERYQDITGDGVIGGWVDTPTSSGTPPTTLMWQTTAPVVDTNGDGVGDRSETLYPNQRYKYNPDKLADYPSFTAFSGGLYLVSMQTGIKESDRVIFGKTKAADGSIVSSPGALMAALPFVESATVNVTAYDAAGVVALQYESTVFGRHDVDVCGADLVTWKIVLDNGRVFGDQQALDFNAEYTVGSQYGGLFLSEKSAVTSIQAKDEPVRRTIETVFTTEPAAGADVT